MKAWEGLLDHLCLPLSELGWDDCLYKAIGLQDAAAAEMMMMMMMMGYCLVERQLTLLC